MGFADLNDITIYFNANKLYGNLLFEHGFCDNDLEVYLAFDKAHRLISKKLLGYEIGVEWGGIYNHHIDGMHFSLNASFLKIITNKK